MSEVKATRRERWDDMQNPGDFIFTHNQAGEIIGMIEMCPCGCGECGGINFDVPNRRPGPAWTWDGNQDAPTLTPSIQRTAGCKWHGYLTAGVQKFLTPPRRAGAD